MSDILFEVWLINVATLFSDTLAQIYRLPVLRLFLGTSLFLVAFRLLAYLFHQGRRGRL